MGAGLSKALGKLFQNREMRILMLGLDAAGKTTILYKLKLNQSVTTIPTVGFNVETVTYKNVKFNVWDVGGQDKIRPLWRHYYTGTQSELDVRHSGSFPSTPGVVERDRYDGERHCVQMVLVPQEADAWKMGGMLNLAGLIFVIDSADRERIDEARLEMERILSDREMQTCLCMVFANKQDLPGAMSPAEVTEKMGLHKMRDRSWYVHPSCATTGEGLFEGLQWLSQNIKSSK